MSDHDEKQLIQRIQHGDAQTAFNPLVQKYQNKIYCFIRKRIKDVETAKDLTQETWMKAYRSIKSFRGDATFYTWLRRIAENVCIDFHRRQKHTNDISIEPLHTVAEHRITNTYPSPCQDIERRELQQMFRNAIANLTPIRKQVFLLYYLQEMPIKEIATLLKRSEGTIKTHLRNARIQLRERLAPYLKTGLL